jgi:hypothetical protein
LNSNILPERYAQTAPLCTLLPAAIQARNPPLRLLLRPSWLVDEEEEEEQEEEKKKKEIRI